MAQDKPAVDPQVSGDQARGAASASGQAKADPKGELTRQEESSAMPAPGQANDHSNVALDPKSNTKNSFELAVNTAVSHAITINPH